MASSRFWTHEGFVLSLAGGQFLGTPASYLIRQVFGFDPEDFPVASDDNLMVSIPVSLFGPDVLWDNGVGGIIGTFVGIFFAFTMADRAHNRESRPWG